MKIKVTGPDPKALDAFTERFMKNIDQQMLIAFRHVALQAVTEARNKEANDAYREAINSMSNARGVARALIGPETPGFNDQTANLRASIGYMIFKDGKLMEENFQGGAGSREGKRSARAAIQDYPTGWALVIVAGMEYASWVEALGYDVISGSTLGLKLKVSTALKKIQKPSVTALGY